MLKIARTFSIAVAAFAFIGLYLPIIVIFILSIFQVRRGRVQWETFSLKPFGEIAANEQLMSSLLNSLLVGIAASLIAVMLASLLAGSLLKVGRRTSQFVEVVVFLPFILPPIVTGLSVLITLREAGIPRGLAAVTYGHVIFVLALAYSVISARARSLNTNLWEASFDLGASRFQTVVHVLLPQMSSALFVAFIFAFTLSLDETMITLFLIGDSTTFPIRLYSLMRVGISQEVNALVALIVLTTIGLAWVGQNLLYRFALGKD